VGYASSPEGSSLGAALLGMTALGMLDSLDRAAELVPVTSVERPSPREAEVYARLQPIFESAYDGLAPVFSALHDLST
jgi:gluconokinase